MIDSIGASNIQVYLEIDKREPVKGCFFQNMFGVGFPVFDRYQLISVQRHFLFGFVGQGHFLVAFRFGQFAASDHPFAVLLYQVENIT